MPDEEPTESRPPCPLEWRGEPRLVVFFIGLDIPIPIINGSTVLVGRNEEVGWLKGVPMHPLEGLPAVPVSPEDDGRNFVSFRFWQVEKPNGSDFDAVIAAGRVAHQVTGNPIRDPLISTPPPDESVDKAYTVVEAVTPLLPVGDGIMHSVTAAFDCAVDSLAMIGRAYLLSGADLRVGIPTRRNLPLACFWTTTEADIKPRPFGGIGLFLINDGRAALGPHKFQLDQPAAEMLMLRLSSLMVGHPIALFAEQSRLAQRDFFVDGDYAAAVIRSQISCEMLFDAVLLLLNWESQSKPPDVAAWFDQSLTARIKARYQTFLGGSWDTTLGKTPIGRWARDVRDLRNRVVHLGYHPTDVEVRQCLATAGVLEDWLRGRVAAKRNQFPRTSLIFLGKPGLERRGLYSGFIKRFAETADEEPAWIRSYRAFVAEFEVARSKR